MNIRKRYDACVEVEREFRAMPYGPSRRSPFKRKRCLDASTLPETCLRTNLECKVPIAPTLFYRNFLGSNAKTG